MAGIFLEHNRPSTGHWRRRSRLSWNLTCIFLTIVVLYLCTVITYEILSEYNYVESENVYISYDGQNFVTDSGEFIIPGDNNAYIDLLSESLESGDKIIIRESKLSGKVLEITSDGDVIYKLSDFNWFYIVFIVLFLGASLAFVCLAFYTINSKKPRGVFAVIQRDLVLK